MLTCLDQQYRNEEFLDQLTPNSRYALRDTAMTLVFGIGWRSAIANLVVDYQIGDRSVVDRILGRPRKPL